MVQSATDHDVNSESCCCSQEEAAIRQALSPAQVFIIGDPQVGKTALLVRYLTRRFIGQYRSSSDMRYTYSSDRLFSTSSSNQYPTGSLQIEFIDVSQTPIEDHLDSNEASFVVVYDICERSTFLTAKRLVWMIRKLKVPARVPVLLIGNKKDLAEKHRQVSTDELDKLGLQCDVIAVETSAASDLAGVTSSFNRLLVETRQFVGEERLRHLGDVDTAAATSSDETSPTNLPRRKASLTILSSLTQMFSNRRKRRKPRTL